MKQKIFVFYANRWSFSSDDGKVMEGTSVHYLSTDDMTSTSSTDGNNKGIRSGKGTLTLNDYRKLTFVPGIYEGDFSPSMDAKGNLTLKLVDLKPLSPVSLVPLSSEKSKQLGIVSIYIYVKGGVFDGCSIDNGK